jgi:LPXTG-site transpeptidase (sortase) family protein
MIRSLAAYAGNALFWAGVAGMIVSPGIWLLWSGASPRPALERLQALPPAPGVQPRANEAAAPAPGAGEPPATLAEARGVVPPGEGTLPDRRITRVRIPSAQTDAEVVPARLVRIRDGVTWEVPAHKVGHAELTAGAGERGNAVLLGHVSSLNAGNVFKDLGRVRVGDAVYITSEAGEFEYRVVDVRVVSRTDLSVLDAGETPALTLITCTGRWLPQVEDFAERLIVRADLSSPGPVGR